MGDGSENSNYPLGAIHKLLMLSQNWQKTTHFLSLGNFYFILDFKVGINVIYVHKLICNYQDLYLKAPEKFDLVIA